MVVAEDQIVLSGELTRADFNAAHKWHLAAMIRRANLPWAERIVMLAVVAVLFVPAVLLTLVTTVDPRLGIADDPDRIIAAVIATCLGFSIAIAAVEIKTRRLNQRIRRLNEASIGPATITFTPGKFDVVLPSSVSSRTPWNAVKRIELTPRHLVFWHDGYSAQFIPRALIGGEVAEADLLAAIRRWAPHLTLPNPVK